MNATSARKIIAFVILLGGFGIGAWASGPVGGVGAMIIGTALVMLPFVVLALIVRFMASSWFSLALVVLATAGTAWFSIEVYPSSRGDAQGALVFVFVPIYLCVGAGIAALLVLLAEITVRARSRLILARGEADAAKAAQQTASARWTMVGSAVLFALVAGTCLFQITRWTLRHHEVNAAVHVKSQEQRLEMLERALAAKDHEIIGILARQDLPGEVLRGIHEFARGNPHYRTMDSLASNPRTPPDLLESLAKDGADQARSVARNPSTPLATLEQLASHTDKHVRSAVAVNPATSESLLTVLAKDGDDMARGAAAHSLKKLKNKGKAGKKKAVAKKSQP